MKHGGIRRLTILASLCAIAFLARLFVHFSVFPVIPFIEYDPKSVVVTLGGFLLGPLAAFIISAVEATVEMVTVSNTGWIGLVMNILATCSFSCTAAFVYGTKRDINRAAIGLVLGTVTLSLVMLLWNYLLYPIFAEIPRSDIVKILVPGILPFNILRGVLDSAMILLIYKPVMHALTKSGLMPQRDESKTNSVMGIIPVAAFVLISCVLVILVLQGRI